MRPPLSSIAFALGAVLLAASPALSQSIPSPYEYLEERQEIGPFFGLVSSGTGRFGYGPDGGVTYGARYAIELSGPLSFEGLAGVVSGHRDVVDPSRLEGDRIVGTVDARVLLVDAGLRFAFTGRRSWRGLAPHLTLGAGMAIDLLDTSSTDRTLLPADVFDFGTSFHGTLGLGTRWFVTDRWAARLDGVFSLWKIDTPPGFSEPDRGFTNVEDGEWIAGNSLTVTLLYRW